MNTKNYLLGVLLIPGMMLAANSAFAAENEEANEQGMERAEERNGTYLSAKPDDAFYAEELTGADVHSTAEDENIGSVTDLIIDEDGQIQGVVIGVGGFLGMGQEHIAMDWGALELTQDEDGDHLIRIDATREALEEAPEFDYDGGGVTDL